ncbi:MAG: DNA-binding protein [Deltaproteobacteria bacterium CG07_land_8_20_14_0_80_38_7]|nr:MAG: DNA-binding protein [Deltaproteobacteria bacterium CG07_land_8_20_14_0_80_38_7]
MNDSNKIENAGFEKQKGDAAMEEANILFKNGKYDGAVSRAYYAAFHYGSAALFSKGLEANSHRGMQRLFHLHFIRTKIFDEEIGIFLSHAQKAREEADYFPEITFSKEIAEKRIQEAEKFVENVRDYLQKIAGI